jgi:hypothetical protein
VLKISPNGTIEVVQTTETFSVRLIPEQRLCLGMIVLSIQDLHLENYFPKLSPYFIIPKKHGINTRNIISSAEFVFRKTQDYTFSFEFCCENLKIKPDELREKIYRNIGKCSKIKVIINQWIKKHENLQPLVYWPQP